MLEVGVGMVITPCKGYFKSKRNFNHKKQGTNLFWLHKLEPQIKF